MAKPKILFYDIETTPLKAWIWRLGKQQVFHDQLDEAYDRYDVICVTYCWNDGKPAKAIGWGYEDQDSSTIITRFDELKKNADVVIGQNSDNFDNRHMNTLRLWHGLKGEAEWTKYTDDLYKQIRKHFYLPSNKLDYLSQQLGLGGKNSMCRQDWIDIVEQNGRAGRQAYKKMLEYGKKDVEDTRAIWEYCSKHFEPKFNMATKLHELACKNCVRS